MSVGSMKLDHIGIAVRSIDECLKIWQDILGLQLNMVKNIPKQKVKVAVLDLKNIKIELLEATEEESTLDKFIEKRGEGLHHLCFEVKEIESVLSDIKEQGVRLIDDVPRIGVSGRKIAFIHPKDMGGVLIELSEKDYKN